MHLIALKKNVTQNLFNVILGFLLYFYVMFCICLEFINKTFLVQRNCSLSWTLKYHAKTKYETKIMCICRELEPMAEHQTQYAFKGKEGHFLIVTIPNIAYPKQTIDT